MNEKCPKDLKHEYRKVWNDLGATSSSSKAIESPALPLEGVHHVHGSHGLPLGVLGVGHGVTDDILQEDLGESLDKTAFELKTKKLTLRTPLVSS